MASVAKTNSKGLDGALWRKIEAKWNREKGKSALEWVQSVTGEKLNIPASVGPDEFIEVLKNGYFLCKLAMKIEPEIWVKLKQRRFKPRKNGGAFVFRNQIEVFTKGLKIMGVRETAKFPSKDLYDGENANNVLTAIYALNAASQKYPGFDGPYIDGGFKASTENKREFTEEQLRGGANAIPFASRGALKLEHKAGLDGAGIVKTAGNEDWHSSSAIPNWSKGSRQIADNPSVDHIVKNVSEATKGHKGSEAVPKMYQPVKMDEKQTNFDAHGIIKNA